MSTVEILDLAEKMVGMDKWEIANLLVKVTSDAYKEGVAELSERLAKV